MSEHLPRRSFLATAAALAALPIVGCHRRQGGRRRPRVSQRPHVAASIFPIFDLVRRIVGETGAVELLLPPGESPYGYELDAEAQRRLPSINLALPVGLELDEWLDHAVRGRAWVIELGRQVDPLFVPEEAGAGSGEEDEEESEDELHEREGSQWQGPREAHFWLDPLRVQTAVDVIAGALMRLDAANARSYRANAATVRAALSAVHARTLSRTAGWPHRSLVTLHTSLTYFAARYDLSIPAILEERPQASIDDERMERTLEVIRGQRPAAIAYDVELDSRPAKAVAARCGLPLIAIDSLGGGPGSTYESIVDGVVSALDVVLGRA